MPRISQLFVYPIKSCRGIEVPAAELTSRGLEFDRRYMLVDADGRFLTQRRHPRMALIEPSFADGGFVVGAPGRTPIRIPAALDPDTHETCTVRVWADTVEAMLAGPSINVWFSEFLGFACGLVYLAEHQHRAIPNSAAAFDDEVGFADGAPLLLISDASLAHLNGRLRKSVGVRHFRPNIVVTAEEPHAEDRWQTLRIGSARLDVAWACSRCVLIAIDPVTGERDPEGEPLRTLQGYRRRDRAVYFGQNLIPRTLGAINAGDECEIDEIIAT